MPSIYSAQPATQQALQRALPLLFHLDSRANTTQNHVLRAMLDTASGREQKLLTQVEDLIATRRLRSQDESLRVSMHGLIERQVRQIVLIASTLGDMSERPLRQLQLQRKRVGLRVIVRRAAETVTPELTQRLHNVSFSWSESGIWVCADAGRLEQVFVNLLSNAAKYTEEGGKIVVSTYVIDGYAVVRVRDSGIGISLALVRSILDSHRGTATAQSAGVGQGSGFTVRLKLDS